MNEIYFIISAIIGVNFYTHYQIRKDDTYFLDEEKPSLLAMLWLIPIIGVGIAQYRLHADKTFYMTVLGILFLFRYGIYALLYVLF